MDKLWKKIRLHNQQISLTVILVLCFGWIHLEFLTSIHFPLIQLQTSLGAELRGRLLVFIADHLVLTQLVNLGLTVVLLVLLIIQTVRHATRTIRAAHYETILEHANDGILITRSGVIHYANPRMAEILGYSVREMQGMHTDHFIAPDQLAHMQHLRQQRAAGRSVPDRYEIAVVRRDGRRIDVEVNAADIQFQGEAASLAIVRDIRERKQLEKQLRDSSDFLAQVLNAVPFPIFVKNQALQYTLVNEAFCRYMNLSAAEVIGRRADDLLPADAADYVTKLDADVFANHDDWEGELTISLAPEKHK
ncbi:MAG: PAS domain S-box protein, partial [Caldilineaceae bacterium]|nr:PAS domain S-box protein [Caldilineaceae bacterium]